MARWSVYGQLGAGQYYNHFPGSHELGHKHRLHDNLERRIALCGGDASSAAHFWPRCWELSSQPQREAAIAAMTQAFDEWRSGAPSDEAKAAEPLWILKPIHMSRGIGIRLVSQWEEVTPHEVSGCLIQRYIDRPLLIHGMKSDLRIYVFVTGVNPLRIYVHDCGLVRFAIEPYVDEDEGEGEKATGSGGMRGQLQDRSIRRGRRPGAHLTNSSLHADSVGYERNSTVSADGVGSKWSLTAFWRHVQKRKDEEGSGAGGAACVTALRDAIDELLVKTVLAAEPAMRRANDQLELSVAMELDAAHAAVVDPAAVDTVAAERVGMADRDTASQTETQGGRQRAGSSGSDVEDSDLGDFLDDFASDSDDGEIVHKVADGTHARPQLTAPSGLLPATTAAPTATAAVKGDHLQIDDHCFEMFGFDVLVDERLKPWLLEVNTSPSLACSSPLDMDVKMRCVVAA